MTRDRDHHVHRPVPTSRRGLLATGLGVTAATAGCLGWLDGSGNSSGDGSSGEASSQPPDRWPMSAGTVGGDGHRPKNGRPGEIRQAWSTSLDHRVGTDPVVAEGTIVLATVDGPVLGVDVDDGSVLWKHETSTDRHAGVAIADGHAVHLDDDGTATALGLADGSVAWTDSPASGSARGAPIVQEKSVVLSRGDGVSKHAVEDGHEEWHLPTEGRPSSVAIGSDLAACTTLLGSIVVFDPTDGTQRRSVGVGASVYVAPTVVGDDVFVQSSDRTLSRYDLETGIRQWRVQRGSLGPAVRPAVRDQIVFAGAVGGPLQARSRATGEPLWAFDERGSQYTAASIVDDRAYLLAGDGVLCVVDVGTGSLLAATQVGGGMGRRLAVASGRAIVGIGDRVVAIE